MDRASLQDRYDKLLKAEGTLLAGDILSSRSSPPTVTRAL